MFLVTSFSSCDMSHRQNLVGMVVSPLPVASTAVDVIEPNYHAHHARTTCHTSGDCLVEQGVEAHISFILVGPRSDDNHS